MMWRTVIILGCFVGAVFTSPVGLKDIPMTDDELLHEKTEMAMSTLNLPSNATSIRADITDGFNCDGRLYGYYADIENDCQIFHVCLPVTYPDGKENTFRWSFICPEDTIFSQESFTCVRALDLGFDCTESIRFYDLNRNFGIAGDVDSDMHDFLRKTPTESVNTIPLEPKPAFSAPTATPLSTRRHPVEPNLRRQPTKAAATTTVASVAKAKPTRVTSAVTITTPAEIKPMFDRNEFMKNSAGIRKTPIRPVPEFEEAKPVEVAPKFEMPTETLPAAEEEIKKIAVESVESEPEKEPELPVDEDNLKQLLAHQTVLVIPSEESKQPPVEEIKQLPEEELKSGKPDLPAETLLLAANENTKEPAEEHKENIEPIVKTIPELPIAPVYDEMPQETPASEQKEELPMVETPASLDSEMLKVSDSSSSASTESKLTEEVFALPESSLKQELTESLASAVVPPEVSPAEEMAVENLSNTKTEMMENDQDSLSSMVQEMHPEMIELSPESVVLPQKDNLKKVETPLPTVESLQEQPLALEDPIVKHVLDAVFENGKSEEQTEEQQLKAGASTDEQLNAEPEVPNLVEASPVELPNNELLKVSEPINEKLEEEMIAAEPEKTIPEASPDSAAIENEMPMGANSEDLQMLKSENKQEVRLDIPTENSQIVDDLKTLPETSNSEVQLKSELEQPMAMAEMTPVEPELPAQESELPKEEQAMTDAGLEMLKSEPELLKPESESQQSEATPSTIGLQESNNNFLAPKFEPEMLNEQANEQPMMQQDEPAMLSLGVEPETIMQQEEPEMLKSQQVPEMPKEDQEPEMMLTEELEPAKEEAEMMQVKFQSDEPKPSDEEIKSPDTEQTLKTVSEKLEEPLVDPLPSQVYEETPAMNSEEQKSEIVKAVSNLVNEATQGADSQLPAETIPAEPALKSEMEPVPEIPEMASVDPEPQPLLDMDTLMASPALLDNQRKSGLPFFIPVKVVMDDEPAPELVADALPEDALKHHLEGHSEEIAPVEIIDEYNKQVTKTAQSEPIVVESPIAEEMVVKNLETPATENEVTQIMLETDPLEMKDKPEGDSQVALKAEILPMPEEEVQIVEDQPNIEMATPEKSNNMEALRLNIPMSEPEQTDSEALSELSQDTLVPTADTRLANAQPLFEEIVNIASNLVKAETMSAPADDFPIVLDAADEPKETETQDSAIFSKSAPTADGLSGAQMADDHPSETVAKFAEPIEEAAGQNDMVSELLRIVAPEKIGELVERTELSESEANRIDLGRSLQKKLDPRKRRFLFKSSAYSR